MHIDDGLLKHNISSCCCCSFFRSWFWCRCRLAFTMGECYWLWHGYGSL